METCEGTNETVLLWNELFFVLMDDAYRRLKLIDHQIGSKNFVYIRSFVRFLSRDIYIR